MAAKLTKEQRDNIINLYLNGMSGIEISKKCKHSTATVATVLKEEGVKVIKGRNNKRFNLNEHYLDKLDSANKFYFLGYFYADGYWSPTTTHISIDSNDKDILEKFQNIFESDRPLQEIKKKKLSNKISWSFRLNSIILHDKIKQYGCDNNKSYNLKFPFKIFNNKEKYLRDFIRGHFEGEGCLSYIKSNSGNIRGIISIVGTEDFIKGLGQILNEQLKIIPTIYKRKNSKNTFYLQFKKVEYVNKFLNWIYYDNVELYMDRKYNKAKEYFEIRNKQHNINITDEG